MPIPLKLYRSLGQGLKVRKLFEYNPQIILSFFLQNKLSHFPDSITFKVTRLIVGTLYVQLLQLLYADYFETSSVLSDDVHVTCCFILLYNPQFNVYHFSSIFRLQCYQYLINGYIYIYVVPFECKCCYSFIHFL